VTGTDEQEKKANQAIGRAMASQEVTERAKVDEVVGRARRAVADARSDVTNIVSKAKQKIARR
jgi:hypothetical protein